jgi:hypothetical protein
VLDQVDYYLDTDIPDSPRLVRGELYREALAVTARRPFRLVPFFDPGPWGGEWMRRRFGLPDDAPNFAWCFDCVPEENSLLFDFGGRCVHSPALPLVHRHPLELLGHVGHVPAEPTCSDVLPHYTRIPTNPPVGNQWREDRYVFGRS